MRSGQERVDSGLFVLTASPDGILEDYLRPILHAAVRITAADAGAALLLYELAGRRPAADVLPVDSVPLLSRAELLRASSDMCRQVTATSDGDAVKAEEPMFRDTRSLLRVPIVQRHHLLGLLQVESTRARAFHASHEQRLADLAEDTGVVASRVLLREFAAGRGFDVCLVGNSPKLLEMERQIRVASSDPRSPVLITGERGSGKELAAVAVHYYSQRRNGPFLPVNSAAFADSLLSDELFGHERHSFTGADTSRAGVLKAAEGGTIFFDEIGDMAPPIQAALLRVLDHGELRRIGRDKPMKVDVRVIGATNRDLRKMVAEGTFRADLYDRLNVFSIEVPPLRDRKNDIQLLATYFLKKLCSTNGRHNSVQNTGLCLSCLNMAGAACARPDFYDRLTEYNFPGNIRELRNLITRVASGVLDRDLGAEHARIALGATGDGRGASEEIQLDAVVRSHIQKVLRMTGNNKSHAARLLGLPLTTLINKMKRLGL
jgi:transcriptional regulator with GAF, ATPase, and Fis domain